LNPFGSWEDFQVTVNRKGFSWKNLIGQTPIDITMGTWTPVLSFGGGTTGIAYADRAGNYTKVGRSVHAHCSITLSNKGSSTGAAVITGLPAPTPSANSTAGAGPVYWVDMTSSLVNFTAVVVGTDKSQVDLYGLTAGATAIALITDADFANASHIQFGVTYFAGR
jgi:hypothetical protein